MSVRIGAPSSRGSVQELFGRVKKSFTPKTNSASIPKDSTGSPPSDFGGPLGFPTNLRITPSTSRKLLVDSALSAFDRLSQSVFKIQDATAEDVCRDLSSARASLERLSDILIYGSPLELRERPIDELLSRAYLYDNPQNSQVKELVVTLNKLGLNLSFDNIVTKSGELVKQSWVNFLQNAFDKNTQVDIVNGVVEFLVNVKDPFIAKGVLNSLAPDQAVWVSSVKGWYDFMLTGKSSDRKFLQEEKDFIRHIVNAAGELGVGISKPNEPGEMYRSPSKRK